MMTQCTWLLCLAWLLSILFVAVSALAPTRPSLFPYQKAGVERLVTDQRCLLADEMGLGKTAQAICALNRLHEDEKLDKSARILVVCPKGVLGVWQDELNTWLDPALELQIHVATGKQLPESSDGIIQLINYDICHKHRTLLQSTPYDVLICDEAHYLKTTGTKRTQAVLGSGVGYEGIKSRYLWLLTGTPIMNRPVELYPLLRAIDPGAWGSFDKFTSRYCDPKEGRWGKETTGASNLSELANRLKPIMVRRYKIDVLTELPPKMRSCVMLDSSEASKMERQRVAELMGTNVKMMTSSKDRGYNLEEFGAEAEGLVEYLGIPQNILEADEISSDRLLGKLATIRKETALMKVRPATQLLKDAILSHKVVVFAHHRALIQDLLAEFGESAVSVVGGMDTESRVDAVRRFQSDDSIRLFIGSIRAAGVGVTLTAASHVVFLELDWSPAIMAQAEDRCHRVGQQDSVQVQYYVFQDTIDEWLARQLLSKQDDIDRVLSISETRSQSPQEAYTMGFGKHKGLRLEDVPKDYLAFIVETGNGGIWRSRPSLWRALFSQGLVHENPPPTQQQKPSLPQQIEPSAEETPPTDVDVDYTFDFGKHRGERWTNVPSSYRDWVIRERVWRSRADLREALDQAGLIRTGHE